MFKFGLYIFLMLLVDCGSLHQSLAISRGMHGADLDGRLYMSVTRSENYNSVIGNKRGEACQNQILFLAAWGDASLPKAKTNGSITTIDHVSFERTVVLNLFPIVPLVFYTKVCTIAYGN